MGKTIKTKSATAMLEAIGQSRAALNSSEITRPIIGRAASPTNDGITSSPAAVINTKSAPAMMPGIDCGSVTSQNTRNGR